MGRHRSAARASQWFVVREGADQVAVDAAIRGALVAQRARLSRIQIDVLSDSEWPADVRWAVEAAEGRLRTSRGNGTMLELDPRSDEDFALAVALAPFTIGSEGFADDGSHIWDANDTGTSAAFELTRDEEEDVMQAVVAAGGAAGDLISLAAHHLYRSRNGRALRDR